MNIIDSCTCKQLISHAGDTVHIPTPLCGPQKPGASHGQRYQPTDGKCGYGWIWFVGTDAHLCGLLSSPPPFASGGILFHMISFLVYVCVLLSACIRERWRCSEMRFSPIFLPSWVAGSSAARSRWQWKGSIAWRRRRQPPSCKSWKVFGAMLSHTFHLFRCGISARLSSSLLSQAPAASHIRVTGWFAVYVPLRV